MYCFYNIIDKLDNKVKETLKNLEKVTNNDTIETVIINLIPYFGKTTFAIEWVDDEDGLIISYNNQVQRFIEIVEDCRFLKKNIHELLDKSNNLIAKAEQSINNHKVQNPSVNISLTQSENKIIKNAHKNNVSKNYIIQFLVGGLILMGVYSVGWFSREQINKFPQNSNNPVINSK